jgi:hypothetical protein
MKKETNNERNAGRKQKYTSPTKLKRIPIIAESEIDELLKPYLNEKLLKKQGK